MTALAGSHLPFGEPPAIPALLSSARRDELASTFSCRARDALKAWDSAAANHPQAALLSFASDAGAARDQLGTTLQAALEAALPYSGEDPSRCTTLLATFLCFGIHRLKDADGAVAWAAQHLLPAVHAAITRLLSADTTFEIIDAAPERTLAALLEVLVAATAVPAKGASAARAPPLPSEALESVVGVIVRRSDAGHAALLRALSAAPCAHAAASAALATELRSQEEARVTRALGVLVGAAALLSAASAKAQPAVSLQVLGFLQSVGRHAPLAVAAGLDAGGIGEWSGCVEAMPVSQRASTQRLLIELTCSLGARGLPASIIAPACHRRLVRILVGRAVDDAADIPSRSHAAVALVELIEAAKPFGHTAQGARGGAEEEEEEAAVDDADSGAEGGADDASSYGACTSGLLAALPAAGRLSKPLTSKLLHTLASLLRHNPWHAALDLTPAPTTRGGANGAWLASVRTGLDAVLAAVETVADATHPMLTLLETQPLGPHALGVLLRRLTAAHAADKKDSHGGGGGRTSGCEENETALMHLLRSQLLLVQGDEGGEGEAACAHRLVALMAANSQLASSAEHCDLVLFAALRPPITAARLVRALVPTIDMEGEAGVAALALLRRAARLEPSALGASLPLNEIEARIRSALGVAAGSHAAAPCTTIVPLVDLCAVSLRHIGGSADHLRFLTSVAPRLALAGASEPLIDAIYAHPLAHSQPALTPLLHALHSRAAEGCEDAAGALMRVLAAAAPHIAQMTRQSLCNERRARLAPLTAAAAVGGSGGGGATDGDEYDYMAEAADGAAEEEEVREALLARLSSDAVHACLPLTLACAFDKHAPLSVRAAAVAAAGRMMLSHESLVELALPKIVALTTRPRPCALRCAATLTLASLFVGESHAARLRPFPTLTFPASRLSTLMLTRVPPRARTPPSVPRHDRGIMQACAA